MYNSRKYNGRYVTSDKPVVDSMDGTGLLLAICSVIVASVAIMAYLLITM